MTSEPAAVAREVAAAMLADATSRIQRLESVTPDIAMRKIPALENRTISEALETSDMWELVDRTLNRHEEAFHNKIVEFGALLVEGFDANRFVLFEHAVLGDRTSGPMPVGAIVRIIDSHSGLVLGHSGSDEPAIWRVDAGPEQAVALGAFSAALGDRVQLRLTSGGHEFSLDDLVTPTGQPARRSVLSKIAAIRTSMERHGVAKRRRIAFGDASRVTVQSSPPPALPTSLTMPAPRAQALRPTFGSSLQPTAEAASPGLVCDLFERVPPPSGITVSSRWVERSFFINVSVPRLAGEASWLVSVEFLHPAVVLESVFPTPKALATDLDSSPVAGAMRDGHLSVLGTTQLQQQVIEATIMRGRFTQPMITLNHYALHFANAEWAVQVLANTARVQWESESRGGDHVS